MYYFFFKGSLPFSIAKELTCNEHRKFATTENTHLSNSSQSSSKETSTTPTTHIQPTNTVGNTDTSSPGVLSSCPCQCLSNGDQSFAWLIMTKKQLLAHVRELAKEIQKDIRIHPKRTRAYIRTKVSAMDTRVSSQVIGSVDGGVLIGVAAIVLSCDCLNLVKLGKQN